MPKYHCLDTEVQLHTSEPVLHHCISDFSDPAAAFPRRRQYSVSISNPRAREDTPALNELLHVDRCYRKESLIERQFEGHEGLNFLGFNTPFFLVCAGKYAVNDTSTVTSPFKNESPRRHLGVVHCFEGPTRNLPQGKGSLTTQSMASMPSPNLMVNESDELPNDSNKVNKVPNVSSLSNLPATVLSQPFGINLIANGQVIRTDKQVIFKSGKPPLSQKVNHAVVTAVSLEGLGMVAEQVRSPLESSNFDVLSKSIEVVVKLSEKSFIRPNSTAESDRCDICINIFYNGEFSASQVIKYSAWASDDVETYARFGGRRVEANRELPWKINIDSEYICGALDSNSRSFPVLAPKERWNKLVAALNMEANEWGRDEHGKRYPTGEYLELISRNAMPQELEKPLVGTGYDFGVIDVVITFGKVSHLDTSRGFSSPLRYLHTNQFQRAGVLPDQQLARRIATTAASINNPSGSHPQSANGTRSFSPEIHPEVIFSTSIADGKHHTVTVPSGKQGQISSSPRATPMHTLNRSPNISDFREATQYTASSNLDVSSHIAKAPTPKPPHPHKPVKVPQKRYRGSKSDLPLSPPPKRRKNARSFEELPVDLSAATYMSTRAKRGTSMTCAKTRPKTESETQIMEEETLNARKSTSRNVAFMETAVARLPRTPKKGPLDNPKTPELGTYMKKKPRGSNYNPKLSNRPQNLRRKNSAGEWIIPPCRKNSAGEWETPIKGDQEEASDFSKTFVCGALSGENGKKPHSVFGVYNDKCSQDLVIGLGSLNKTPPNMHTIVVNGNIGPEVQKNSGNPVEIATSTDSKNEKFINCKEAGQSTEIVRKAITTQTTHSHPTITVEHAVNNLEVDSLENNSLKARFTFDTYFKGLNEDSTVSKTIASPSKKSLRLRFFQIDRSIDGEIADGNHNSKRWLAERCDGREQNFAKDFTDKDIPSSPPSGRPKRLLRFANSFIGGKVTNPIRYSAVKRTAHPRLKSNTNDSGHQALQGETIDAYQENQNVEVNRRQFVVPEHKPRTLKLVSKREITAKLAEINESAKLETEDARSSYRPNDTVVADQAENDEGGSVTFEINEHYQESKSQDLGLNILYTKCQDQKEPAIADNMELRTSRKGQGSMQTTASAIDTGRLFRPRTVGSTELKALLESHDRHSVINIPHGTPLRLIKSQLMTRSSRKFVSLKTHKLVTQRKAVADTKYPFHSPVLKLHHTNKGSTRRRSSSGQFVQKPTITTSVQNHITDAGIDGSKNDVAQTAGDTGPSDVNNNVENLLMKSSTQVKPEMRSMTAMGYDMTGVGVEGFIQPISDIIKINEAAEEIDTAAGGIKSLTAHALVRRESSNTNIGGAPSVRTIELSDVDIRQPQEHTSSVPTPLSRESNRWKPGHLCRNSIITYVEAESWSSTDKSPASGQLCKEVVTQEQGCFKASGVLMGVRYVVVGSAGVSVPANL